MIGGYTSLWQSLWRHLVTNDAAICFIPTIYKAWFTYTMLLTSTTKLLKNVNVCAYTVLGNE